ncbi:hypothetical protein GUJ93_ZPchr0010g7473 [Zizania palustris]|uniref:BRCT domain-containing protein n=1 Tax=Zizania palustris TaxID=103762 RepID=A0A8J5WHE2_ZIZPA|nr:hypothetical protein GUJ93_ZPchr0010g7473 [Zizania palustris]
MVARDPHSGAPASPSYVRVVDRSKYGTFVNKVQGTQGSQLHKDEDVMLTDGDTVTFGTGNATFRLSFVSIIVFFHGRKSTRISPSLQAVMASIGAYATRKWSNECTHVLADESCSLTAELLDAILLKQQIVLGDWFKAMAEKSIHTEIPSCTQYIPKLTLDGMEIKMVETKLIENCLAGYIFILGSLEKYKFGDKLHALLESTGAKYIHIDEFCANSQVSGAGENDKEILVVPAKSPLEFSKIRALFPLSKITDMKLFAAILSGHLEATAVEPPAYIVASSNSTDETIVVDSDVEIDTATSDHIIVSSKSQHHIDHISDDKKDTIVTSNKYAANLMKTMANIHLCNDLEKNEKAKREDVGVITKVPKKETLDNRDETCHVIYRQDLVVKSALQSVHAMPIEISGSNFKRFRKRETMSGNSFKDLIPYSREPYRESDYERGTVTDFMREEKKRRQMEAVAEDLFNNLKSKKKAAAGSSIHTILIGRR